MPRKHSHRRSRTGRRVILTAAAAAAAAGITFGVISAGSAAPGGGSPQPGALSAPAGEPAHKKPPAPLTSAPKADKRRGLVYEGLKPAPKGDRCVGVYSVSRAGLCTHGPDAPPKGIDITKDTPPAAKGTAAPSSLTGDGEQAPSATEALRGAPAVIDARKGAVAAAAAAPGPGSPAGPQDGSGSKVVCEGDGATGNRVQVLYVHAPGRDRFGQYAASFKQWAAETDVIYNASAKETGGERHVRYVTEADCTVSVLDVEVSAGDLQEFGAMNNALAAKGFNRRDRKYMVFADAQVYCGIGTFNGDERPGQDNLSNFGPSYGRTDSGCWGGSTPAHELGHNLGAVNNSAPHTSKAAHCVDEWDIMCYSDAPYYPKMQVLCPERSGDQRLDCGHDDYFHTNPKPGSYLATHWNIANNRFLMADGGTGNPDPGPTPTRTPGPGPTRQPSAGPDAQVSQITPNSAVVSWTKVPSAAGYDVLVDGKKTADVKDTVVRLTNLAPGTAYKVAVAARGTDGKASEPGRAAAFRTLSTDGGSPTRPGTPYLMVNGLTGQAVDLWGGSAADGTVAIAYQRHGYANQQWLFENAGGGVLRVKSAQSGKCLELGSGGQAVAGQYVAQRPCRDTAAQKWRLNGAGGGAYVLQPEGSSLVLGISKRWYYGGWLLELQQKNGQGYQNWTLAKAAS
ncbi:RICIN domain-containing protein [Streptomyces roseoverticillatus]|uniref:RICIN domain-containing protein n=1 Tax=Streptomyces roseoverticillatus TaxID=66429 RepID=UPI001F434CE2|nr:RICIN domain-containing protein [Streptomyces roseoverticillatus]